MEKIYYDENGWVCKRYPYNIEITDVNRFIEVDEETANKTYVCDSHYSWKVVNNELKVEQYEQIPETETIENLRTQRQIDCFSIIDRSCFWYEQLNEQQKNELKQWYQSWLNVTVTKTIPNKPSWLV